jgi:lipopolysaccharide transport system ATP-binding protein
MLSDSAIEISEISKIYRIGLKEKRHDSLGAALISFFKSPLKNYSYYKSLYKFKNTEVNINGDDSEKNHIDTVWALKNVSFKVERGTVLGVIGGNGAGKSTLLKILSRITDPTRGRAKIRGRVSSLLEVGTGFHQELTGRDNVYLNGCILGMKKSEIDRKFDEIVNFSGIEKFIDTPVKRYSSGMSVRLAFSVAAHLEPEVLLIDEVLAVGDVAFQRKCIGKMNSVAREGRTILFVSHNMGAVTNLCNKTLWLDKGQVKSIGESSVIVTSYLSEKAEVQATWDNPKVPSTDQEVSVRSVYLLSNGGEPMAVLNFGESFSFVIIYEVIRPVRDLSVCIQITNSQGILIYETIDTDLSEHRNKVREPGKYSAKCFLDDSLLKPDNYYVSVVPFIERIKIIERHDNVLSFTVSETNYNLHPGRLGVVAPVFKWDIERLKLPDSGFLKRDNEGFDKMGLCLL